jgi:NitT/TauT family transport system substrate-binding protein/sulfonate transport system substrate-binding protein
MTIEQGTDDMIARRTLLAGVPALVAARRATAAPAKVLRVGTQKGAALLMAERQRRGLETLLAPLGIEVRWTEFQFGPPLLEAMRIGGVDLGLVGDTPPIFAQAARSDLLYVAVVPSGASAILLPAGSSLQTLRDLKGKRVAFARGSSAHNLTIAALEKAGLTFGDIQASGLAPADAAAAFEKGAIDAWTIWDPFYALYETRPGVRVLAESTGIAPQNSFVIASRSFVETNPDTTAKVLDELANVSDWALAHRPEVARLVTDATSVPYEATARAMQRAPFRMLPISAASIQSQQDIADRFHRLGVIPNKIAVAGQVWTWHPAA